MTEILEKDERIRLEEKVLGQSRCAKTQVKEDKVKKASVQLQAAWEDDDENDIEVDLMKSNRLRKLRKTEEEQCVSGKVFQERLQEQFTKTYASVEWASLDALETNTSKRAVTTDEDNDSDQENDTALLRESSKLLSEEGQVLAQGTINIQRVKDANRHAPSSSVVQSVQFHPNGQLLLTAGYDKTLRLFQVDGSENAKIQSIHVQDLPIRMASFTADGNRVYMSGGRPYYYIYDINAGRVNKIPRIVGRKERHLNNFVVSSDGQWVTFLGSDGYMPLLSQKSGHWVGNLKMNGQVTSACFSPDANYMYSTGSDGDVYKWDMRTRRCLFKHHDEGSLGNASIACGFNGHTAYYATGAESGVVNIYSDKGDASMFHAKPEKTLLHLTTPVDTLKFNTDSQVMAMSSKNIQDSMKLVHLPSFTVFSNWPTARTPLHYVSSLDFSPNSGYLACGNDRGRVLLYRLKHYRNS